MAWRSSPQTCRFAFQQLGLQKGAPWDQRGLCFQYRRKRNGTSNPLQVAAFILKFHTRLKFEVNVSIFLFFSSPKGLRRFLWTYRTCPRQREARWEQEPRVSPGAARCLLQAAGRPGVQGGGAATEPRLVLFRGTWKVSRPEVGPEQSGPSARTEVLPLSPQRSARDTATPPLLLPETPEQTWPLLAAPPPNSLLPALFSAKGGGAWVAGTLHVAFGLGGSGRVTVPTSHGDLRVA